MAASCWRHEAGSFRQVARFTDSHFSARAAYSVSSASCPAPSFCAGEQTSSPAFDRLYHEIVRPRGPGPGAIFAKARTDPHSHSSNAHHAFPLLALYTSRDNLGAITCARWLLGEDRVHGLGADVAERTPAKIRCCHESSASGAEEIGRTVCHCCSRSAIIAI